MELADVVTVVAAGFSIFTLGVLLGAYVYGVVVKRRIDSTLDEIRRGSGVESPPDPAAEEDVKIH